MFTYYSEKVRSYRKGDDMIIEVLKGDNWEYYWETNERSNDYAYTELRNVANSLASNLKLQGV